MGMKKADVKRKQKKLQATHFPKRPSICVQRDTICTFSSNQRAASTIKSPVQQAKRYVKTMAKVEGINPAAALTTGSPSIPEPIQLPVIRSVAVKVDP